VSLYSLVLLFVMSRRITLVRHMSREGLESRCRVEKDARVKERALAMLRLYDGATEEETARSVVRCEKSVRNWLKRWNEKGYDGLAPEFDGGPKPRIDSGEWDKIVQEIEGKGMTIRDVEVYVKDTRGVHYAYKTVWEVLRKEKKVKYGKAYKMNAKRPPDAEGILKKI
jgi:putative transposase